MNPILESLPNLLGYSVPTVLVIGGLVLFFLPFFRELQPAQMRSARRYGAIVGVIGIVLALLIKPPISQPQLVPVYILPTPANVSSPGGNTAPATVSVPSINTAVIQATVTETARVEQPVATELPPSPTTPILRPDTDIPPSPTVPVLPQATDNPKSVTSVIPVWAIDENGVRVNITASGIYKVSYLGDAYSPWPNEQYEGYRGWTTIVRIYVNRPVEWGRTDYGLIGPINQNDYLGPGGYYLDKNQAIATSTGDSRTFRLSAGDFVTLVTLDEKGRYGDNQGKVDIGITYLGQ